MQLYWSLASIPELAALPPNERRRTWRAAHWRARRDWRMWATLLVSALGCATGIVVGEAFGWPTISGLVGAGAGGLLQSQITVDLGRPHIAAASVALGASEKRPDLHG